jgi:battenin
MSTLDIDSDNSLDTESLQKPIITINTAELTDEEKDALLSQDRPSYYRNIISFFLFGLINNYGYVVFGSAATAILNHRAPVGVLLLCEILPAFLISGVGSWFLHFIPYIVRMWLVVILSIVSFIIVGLWGAESVFIALFGIVVGSFASGLGEPSFLALSSFYHKSTVSAWSSGTGFAGVFGSFTYLFYTSSWGANLSNANTLYCMAPTPLIMALAYIFLLTKPAKEYLKKKRI